MIRSVRSAVRYFGVLEGTLGVPHNEADHQGNMFVKLLKSLPLLVVLLALTLTAPIQAQDNNDTPLGDIARSLRKNKQKPADPPVVIDNDNLDKVMEQAESEHMKGEMKFFLQGGGKDGHGSSPDVTCNLSFSADGASASDGTSAVDLPTSEIPKLDGPATINGDTLQVAVYNGTQWKIREITVGLTILRPPDASASYYGAAQLRPASDTTAPTNDQAVEKRSDITVLYHLKGLAAPLTTSVFRQSLGVTLHPDQEWHWAIVQARGIPPR